MIHSQAMTEYQRQTEHYAAVKRRLYGLSPKAPRLVAKNDNIVVEPDVLSRWVASDIAFDQHIKEWVAYKKSIDKERQWSSKKTMVEICYDVLKLFPQITMRDILSPTRVREITRVRQLMQWEIKKQRPDVSLPMMGRFFKRDHTSCLAAVRKINEIMADGELKWYLERRREFGNDANS